MSFEFLIEKVGIPVSKLAVTVYKGNDKIPCDTEAVNTWLELGLSSHQIFFIMEMMRIGGGGQQVKLDHVVLILKCFM